MRSTFQQLSLRPRLSGALFAAGLLLATADTASAQYGRRGGVNVGGFNIGGSGYSGSNGFGYGGNRGFGSPGINIGVGNYGGYNSGYGNGYNRGYGYNNGVNGYNRGYSSNYYSTPGVTYSQQYASPGVTYSEPYATPYVIPASGTTVAGSTDVVPTAAAEPAPNALQVTSVDAGGASKAGIQAGDVILKVDGRRTMSFDDLRTALGTGKDRVSVEVFNPSSGKRSTKDVTVADTRIGVSVVPTAVNMGSDSSQTTPSTNISTTTAPGVAPAATTTGGTSTGRNPTGSFDPLRSDNKAGTDNPASPARP